MLLKDILGDKKGWPTRSGSRFVPATPAPLDATLVARFEAVGLVALGKSMYVHLPEGHLREDVKDVVTDHTR